MATHRNKYGYPQIPEHPTKKGFVDFDRFTEMFFPVLGSAKASINNLKIVKYVKNRATK